MNRNEISDPTVLVRTTSGYIEELEGVSAILFDLDGTLISTLDLHVESFRWILKKLGRDIGREDLEKMMGLTPQDIIQSFFEGIDYETLWSASQEKENYLETLIDKVYPFPGVEKFLQTLSGANIKCAVISSTHRKLVEILLKSAGLLKYFDEIVSGDEITFGKPDPEPFVLGIKKLGVDPNQAVGIGDSIYDEKSCTAAKIRFLAVLTGKTEETSFGNSPNIVIMKSMLGIFIKPKFC